MSNLPTTPVIAPADGDVEGMNSGMNAGGSDSCIGICTDNPNPKAVGDWPRIVVGATRNPIGYPQTDFQYAAEYGLNAFTGSPVGFAPADTQAAPGEVYATNVEGTGWDLTNKTSSYTTEVGDWLWGIVGGGGASETYLDAMLAFKEGRSVDVLAMWILDDGASNSDNPTAGVSAYDYGLTSGVSNYYPLKFESVGNDASLWDLPTLSDDDRRSWAKSSPNGDENATFSNQTLGQYSGLIDEDGSFTFSVVLGEVRGNNPIVNFVDAGGGQSTIFFSRSGDELRVTLNGGYRSDYPNIWPEGDPTPKHLIVQVDNSGGSPQIIVNLNGVQLTGDPNASPYSVREIDWVQLFPSGSQNENGYLGAQYAWLLPGVVSVPEVEYIYESWVNAGAS